MSNKYKIIDLFAGCGGFSQGFLKAGFEIVAANEFWNPAIETYRYNHKNVNIIEGDITLPETKQKLYDAVSGEKINLIIGGPPCQGYSISGNRNPDDPRGQLYLDYAEIVNHLKPDFFIMENVKGLLHMNHVKPNLNKDQLKKFKINCEKLQKFKDLKRYAAQRELMNDEKNEFVELKNNLMQIKKNIESKLVSLIDKILLKFKEINYSVSWEVLNSANYGVPQMRERVIFIGTKYKNIKIEFPRKTHIKKLNKTNSTDLSTNESYNKLKMWISTEEILKTYENWSEDVEKNHIFTNHSDKFIQKLKNTPIGTTVYRNYSDSWWRLDPNKPAKTVKENHGGVFVHYKFDRVCTPRELAALQSFDDNFIFKGTKSEILKQIGNAVPPVMAEAIGKKVKILLDKV